MLRQEDKEFEASLGHIASSKPAWAIYQDPISKRKRKKRGKEGKEGGRERGRKEGRNYLKQP
jgi:hypothetical protein